MCFNVCSFFHILDKNVKADMRPFLELKRITSWVLCVFLAKFPPIIMFIAQVLLTKHMKVRRLIPTLTEGTPQLGETVYN